MISPRLAIILLISGLVLNSAASDASDGSKKGEFCAAQQALSYLLFTQSNRCNSCHFLFTCLPCCIVIRRLSEPASYFSDLERLSVGRVRNSGFGIHERAAAARRVGRSLRSTRCSCVLQTSSNPKCTHFPHYKTGSCVNNRYLKPTHNEACIQHAFAELRDG